MRGVAFANRACEYGSTFRSYLDTANDTLLCVVQIETEASVKNVRDIAAVEGVDVLFIGPSDLSQGMGIFGEFRHPTFVDAVARTSRAAAEFGKIAGILLPKPEDFAFFHEFGFRFLASGADGVLLNNAARSLVKTLRASLESARSAGPAGLQL